MHTDDVPGSSLAILSQIWRLKRVDFVQADSALFYMKGTRFDGVFTKLHALGLTEYEKVLMLDIDLTVLRCPDELFELWAPAAMCRGVRGGEHGTRLNCRFFFAGELEGEGNEIFDWCQNGGINAGIMLLAPEEELYQRALREVRAPFHPEHVPGAGPEQDYLSRLFAPYWTHMSVRYNYQLHQVFIALSVALQGHAAWAEAELDPQDPEPWIPERLSVNTEDLRVVHYSGELKTWDRDPLGGEDDDTFTERLLRGCSPDSLRLWGDRAGEDWEYAEYGVRKIGNEFLPIGKGPPLTPLVDRALSQARAAARLAVRQWRADLEAVPSMGLPALPELLRQLREPAWPAEAAFARGAKVEIWYRDCDWYPGTVESVHEDGTFAVAFDEPGFWGTGARNVRPERLRAAEPAASEASDVAAV